MKILYDFRSWLQKRQMRKHAIDAISREVDSNLRAHALYVYMTLELERVTGKRPSPIVEYEAFCAYIMANVVTSYSDPKGVTKAMARINTHARTIARHQPTIQ